MGKDVRIDIDVDFKKAGLSKMQSDKVRLFALNSAFRLMNPYIPMDTGTLSQTVDITSACIHFKVPYADRIFNGDGMDFSKEKHALATAHWEQAMMSAKSAQLSREVTAYLKRGI